MWDFMLETSAMISLRLDGNEKKFLALFSTA
jgi:hypothetical protein